MIAFYNKTKNEGYLLFSGNYDTQSIPAIRLNDADIQDLVRIACKLYTEAFGEKYREEDEE